MKKYTQKRLKELVVQDHAVDISMSKEKIKGLKQIGYSAGRDGCNGMLLESEEGKLFAIIGRTSTLFLY